MTAEKRRPWLCLGVLGVFALMVFRIALPAGQTVLASDFNFSNLAVYKRIFPTDLFHGSWTSANLLGIQGMRALNLTNLLLVVFPLTFFADWIYAFHLVLASWLFILFLRLRGLAWSSCLMGALVAFWTGSNLTLIYAGHLYKYGVLVFGSAALLCVEKALRTGRTAWAVLAGGAAGLMFQEQQDLAVFYALLVAAYALWAGWRHRSASEAGPVSRQMVRLALPAALVAAVIMIDPFLRAKHGVIDSATITRASDQEKWNWATQWSWPPEETIDFIAPGYHGLRSGEPEAPYWGRMGRTAGWEQSRQGFGNFKLESQYLGVLPVLLMLAALLLARPLRGKDPGLRGEILFWGGASLLLFLLSCGKYLPVYRLFYALPMVDSIRNPNKFLQVMQVAMGALAAVGFDALFQAARRSLGVDLPRRLARAVLMASGALAAVLLIALLGAAATGGGDGDVAALGLAPLAAKIREQKIGALLHGLLFAACGLGLLAVALFRPGPGGNRLPRLGFAVLALTGADILLLASPYIVARDIASTINNPVAAWLAKESGPDRVHAVSQDGVYGYIIANDFPYHGVNYANLLAAPRLPGEYEAFLKATSSNLPRFWDLFGVRHVLVAAPMWKHLQAMPGLNGLLKPVLGWNVEPRGPGGVGFAIAQAGQPAQHLVLDFPGASGRAVFVPAWKVASDEETLAALADPKADVRGVQWVSADTGAELPASALPSAPPVPAKVTKRINDLLVSLETPGPGVLRLADKHGPRLRVEVDGKPAKLLRCQYLFPGVFIPSAGNHEVRFWYQPDRTGLALVVAGLTACLGALPLALRSSRPPAHGAVEVAE